MIILHSILLIITAFLLKLLQADKKYIKQAEFNIQFRI